LDCDEIIGLEGLVLPATVTHAPVYILCECEIYKQFILLYIFWILIYIINIFDF